MRYLYATKRHAGKKQDFIKNPMEKEGLVYM